MRGHPCPHSCCQGKRVHPDALPVRLSRAYLKSLSDEEVERELSAYQNYSDERTEGYIQVIAELQRREDQEQAAKERAEAREQRGRAARESAREKRARENQEYTDEVYRQWLSAENATNGYMLNKAGKAAGISDRSLFTGPESRVRKYASPELAEYFDAHPRMTRREWDARRARENREQRTAYAKAS
jgi:hypothetical protein